MTETDRPADASTPFRSWFARFETVTPPLPTDAPSRPPEALWPFLRWALREARVGLWGLALASLAVGAADAGVFWMIGALVDLAAQTGPERFFAEHWGWLAAMLVVIAVIKPAAQLAQSAFSSLTLNPALFPMTVFRLHRHTLGQSMKFFEEDFTGRLAQKQMQTANAVTQVANDALTTLGMLVAYAATMLAALAAADGRLAALAVLWLGGFFWVLWWSLPRIRLRAQVRAEARAGVTGQLVDSLGHIETVKLFAHAGREEAAAARSLRRFHDAALQFGRAMMAMRTLLAILNAAATLAMLGLGLWLWRDGSASIGAVAAAAMLTLRLTQMANWMAMSAMAIFGEIGTIEDGARTLSPAHGVTDRPGAADGVAAGPIRFENVVFRYGRATGGVGPLDFEVAEGEKLALVGRSGAGKSTLVGLLLRLRDVEQGRIAIGGVDIRDMTQDGLRRMIGVVTQETAIFNRSALDNILYGRPEASVEEAVAAARAAQADDFIRGLRDGRGREGYAAHLGERGVKLSGGQRQRIALARAILKDAPILVLDEATSALDSEVEAEIQQALRAAMAGKTVLAIAHRLSTIAEMDRILTLDEGRVVEAGAHAALLAQGGLYAGLWARQSGGFLPLEAAE
ncbi:MAG: ABC transporter ATP-binding protein [Rubrimonas sp.]|uniref:ABC transporter ATP-binding protein n=1 Tax=Rubrimonas sp. TaxID=2036015 RepID=UPI002FDEB965